MSIKSKTALEFSMERFFKGFSNCYMWTFTFADVIGKQEMRSRWQTLVNGFNYHKIQGIRVFEVHPLGHGFHIHMVTRFRYDVNFIRHLCVLAGFGRIHVMRCPVSASSYLTKYVSDFDREGCQKGMRLWAGIRFQCTHIRSLVHTGGVAEMIRRLSDNFVSRHVLSFNRMTEKQKAWWKWKVAEAYTYLGDDNWQIKNWWEKKACAVA